MDAFSLSELSAMQAAQEAGMMDVGVILHHVDGATDAYGIPVDTWVEGSVTVCGYDGRRHIETGVPGGTGATQVALTDGRLRLPIDADVSTLDRFRLTERFGVMLETPILYEFIGETRRGPSGLLVDVRLVVSNG